MWMMPIKKKIKLNLNKIFILAVVITLSAGICACERKEDGADVSSDNNYSVLSVDSVEEKGIDYGKYEIRGSDDGGKNNASDGSNLNDDVVNSGANDKNGGGGNNNGIEINNGVSSENEKIDGVGSNGADKSNGSNKSGDNEKSSVGSKSEKGNNGKDNNGVKGSGREDKYTGSQQDNNNTVQSDSPKTNSPGSGAADSGIPAPSEPQDIVVDKTKVYKCTLLVECKALLSDMDKLDSNKRELVPEDGIILEKQDVEFSDGESAFDVLLRETKNEKIHMEYSFTPIYNSSYIEGIANLYEFDCGELSGWVYSVNDKSPGYGISRYSLKDGDVIHVEYTLERQ